MLTDLGWSADFLRQLDMDELHLLAPARISAVHRDRVSALAEDGPALLTLPPDLSSGDLAVGDWVLADPDTGRLVRLLDRRSRIFRRAAGEASREQLIVANVDTVFITTSCTAEFNEARLERYLALCHAGGIPPVLVLTKADQAGDPQPYLDRLRAIAPKVPAIALDARAPDAATRLRDWCGPGRTVAFLGMSGVGKSTLASALSGRDLATGAVRADDLKGRHTTTARELHPLPGGGWLIDTPGMRAVRLAGVEEGIDAVFADVTDLAAGCRFTDCQHDTEPGCAVQAAIEAGDLDPARLARWQKLKLEEARHSESLAQANARGKRFGKMVKEIKRVKPRYRE